MAKNITKTRVIFVVVLAVLICCFAVTAALAYNRQIALAVDAEEQSVQSLEAQQQLVQEKAQSATEDTDEQGSEVADEVVDELVDDRLTVDIP